MAQKDGATVEGYHQRVSSTTTASKKKTKSYSTQYSQVVPHLSTNYANTSLTSEIGRDPVLPGVYGHNCFLTTVECTRTENVIAETKNT